MAAVGGVLILIGCFLPWWRLGGGDGLPVVSGNAFDGSGILVFLVGVASLFLVALPYAVGDRPTGLDRWVSYAILAAVGWIGLGWRVVDLFLTGAFRYDEPIEVLTNNLGLWVAGLGLVILARAAYQMTREPRYR
jgi:hypothetical protein